MRMNNPDDTQPVPRRRIAETLHISQAVTMSLVEMRDSITRRKARKLAVAARHKEGTRWHTRAKREARFAQDSIDQINALLKKRETR
jgi:hypothetical protein